MPRNFLGIRIWLVLLVIAISLSGTTVFAQGGTVVRVEPATLAAKVNDSVTLAIKIDNVANLTALELHLAFNPSVLEVVQVTNGGFVTADFVAQNTFDNAAGTIDYAVAQMNRAPAQGSGTLLNLVFRAKANGSSTVALRSTQAVQGGLLLSDSNGMAILASWVNGSVNVGSPVPATATPVTPVPATATPVTPGAPSATPVTPVSASATPVTPTPITPTPVPYGAILGTHVVRLGESLYCIGRAYKVTPWAIAEKNGVWWPYLIFPNQKLLIPNITWSPIPAGPVCQVQFTASAPIPTPVSTTRPATPTAISPTVVPPSGCRVIHVVRPGENLYRIAIQYGTSYAEIARINQLSNARLIFSGQRLCIP